MTTKYFLGRLTAILVALAAFDLQEPAQGALVYHYEFDGNALDSAGVHQDGMLKGDATFSTNVPPAFGGTRSLQLDGTLDKMIYDTIAPEGYISGTFTVAAWANVASLRPLGTHTFVGTRGPDNQFGLDFKYRIDGAVRLDIGNGANSFLTISDTQVNYELNEWHHLATTVTPTGYKLYFDGNLVRTVAFNGTAVLLDAGHNLAIGAISDSTAPNGPPNGEDFHGLIDDVRIYDTALSADEVHAIIPEPSTIVLGLLAGVGLLACRRRRGRTLVTRSLLAIALLLLTMEPVFAAPIVAFYDDFDQVPSLTPGVTAMYSGATTTTDVQGYAGVGTATNVFSGRFLRNDTGMAFPFGGVPASPVVPTTLTLENLPAHDSVDLRFLLAAIDSWDGNSQAASPDFFRVNVDGQLVFSETLDYADLNDQSYSPPPGGLLTHGVHRGFNSQFRDAAYDMGLEARLSGIPHTAQMLTVQWYAGGAGWTAAYFSDESWAIENVEVVLNTVPEPSSAVLGILAGVGLLVWRRRWRSDA